MESQRKRQTGQSGFDGNDELRTIVVKVRFSPTEYDEMYEQFKDSTQRAIGVFVRTKTLSKPIKAVGEKELLVNAAQELVERSKLAQELKELNRHLAQHGNNLNQIARDKNSGESLGVIVGKLEDVLNKIKPISDYAENLIAKLSANKNKKFA